MGEITEGICEPKLAKQAPHARRKGPPLHSVKLSCGRAIHSKCRDTGLSCRDFLLREGINQRRPGDQDRFVDFLRQDRSVEAPERELDGLPSVPSEERAEGLFRKSKRSFCSVEDFLK